MTDTDFGWTDYINDSLSATPARQHMTVREEHWTIELGEKAGIALAQNEFDPALEWLVASLQLMYAADPLVRLLFDGEID